MQALLTGFKRAFPRVFAYLKAPRLLFSRRSSLVENGLLHTYTAGYPCRRDGAPIPGMNYSVIASGAAVETRHGAVRIRQRLLDVVLRAVRPPCRGGGVGPPVARQAPGDDAGQRDLLWRPFDTNGDYCRAAGHADERFDVRSGAFHVGITADSRIDSSSMPFLTLSP